MRSLLALATLVVVAPLASAQVSVVDEGSFTISRGGARVGRESFTIRRTPAPGGPVVVAVGTVDYSDQRLSPALRTDSVGAPLAYQVEVKAGPETRERLTGQVGRGRFTARTWTPGGESAKEYIVSDGAMVLDDDVFHQYYFVAQGKRGATIPVVVPRRNVQLSIRVQPSGEERIVVGGTPLTARHLTLTEPDGGVRQLWVDGSGRVLKVVLERRGIVALRDEPPR